jgi:hypothetical protein
MDAIRRENLTPERSQLRHHDQGAGDEILEHGRLPVLAFPEPAEIKMTEDAFEHGGRGVEINLVRDDDEAGGSQDAGEDAGECARL